MAETKEMRSVNLLSWEKIKYLCFAPALLVIFFIFFHHPHYGLMDDSQHLFLLLPRFRELGFIGATMEYFYGDLNLGVVRITYPPMVWFLYGPGREYQPLLTFGLNWLFVTAVTAYIAVLLSKILKLPFAPLFAAPFAIYYFHDLYLFPSLQEKLLLVFGISLIYLSSAACNLRWSVRAPLMILAAVLGGVTKTNFVIFFLPATVLLFWDWAVTKKSKFLSFVGPFLVFVLITGILAYFAARGSYNGGRYSLEKAVKNLMSFSFFYLTAPALLSMLWVKKAWKDVGIRFFIPALCLLGFYFVFLPWGIEAYIQTVVISFVAASIVQAIHYAPVEMRWKNLAYLGIIGVAVLISSYRSNRNFLRMADLRDSLQFVATKIQPEIPIYADCPEGHLAMQRYVQNEGNPAIQIQYWLQIKEHRANHFYFVGDAALCPIVEKIDGCEGSIIQSGHFAKSFKVMEWKCGRS